jgi:RHS repeat-associated protein
VSGFWEYALGTGAGFSNAGAVTNIPTDVISVTPMVVDVDGDGRQDLVLSSGITPACHGSCALRFNGTNFDAPVATQAASSGGRVLDSNGDGLMDIAGYYNSTYGVKLHLGVEPDLVSSIEDGFGNIITLTYAPMADGSVYSKASTPAVFPYMDVVRPINVVKQYTKSDGLGGSYAVSATYNGMRFHAQGRGYVGFLSRTETDGRTGIKTTYNLRQDFPYTGLVASMQTTQSNGNTIASVTNTLANVNTGTATYQQRYFPYVQNKSDTQYEVSANPAIDGAAVRQVSTTRTVDSYGNDTNLTIVTSDLTGTNLTYTDQIVTTIPSFDTTNWCLDFATQRTESRSTTTLTPLVRTVQYLPDSNPSKCRVYQEIVEPAYTNLMTTTTYQYDAFGNVNRTDVAAAGITTRTTLMGYGSQGVFPTLLTNAASETSQRTFDYATGAMMSFTDPNGIAVNYSIDGFGRRTRAVRADGTATAWTFLACTSANGFCGDSLLRSETQEQEIGADGATVLRTTLHRLDSLGRPKSDESQTLSGTYSIVRTLYDNLGRVSQKSLPYLAGSTAYFSTTQYDILGRPKSVQRQVSQTDSSLQSTLYDYNRLTTTITDPYTLTTVVVRNALGEQLQVTDSGGTLTKYEYEQFGNLTKITDPFNNQVISSFDRRGFKRGLTDPDLGAWTYDYYPTGELKSITDPRTQQVIFTYDGVSRVMTRQEPEGLSNFNIGTSLAAKNIGKIESVSSPGGYAEHYVYDSHGRLQDLRTTIDAVDYTVSRTYSSTSGLLETVTYPTSTSAVPGSRFAVKYEYANDILQRVRDLNAPTTVYWEQDASDAYGNATDVLLGNGLHTYSAYDPVNGELATRTSGPTSQVQNLAYQWDKIGNLTQRQDSNLNLTEHFYYDSHYRLDHSTLNGTQNLAMTYDTVGNIQTKTGVGSYGYDTTRKHAVVTAGTHSYAYDANGNMITRDGSGITYTSYNLPTIVNSGSSAQFFYGANRDRYKQIAVVAAGGSLPAGTETTLYVGGMFEKVTKASGVTEYKHYIAAGGDAVAVRTLRSSGVNDTRYLYKDHLGSVDVITDDAGALVSRLSYDAFGARRGSGTWSGNPSANEWSGIAAVTHRGFTYQEHVDDVGLIHMNGRMYDPLIGRFISADPVVPDSLGAQAANRYAYVGNNPLSLTDRSGYEPGDGGTVTVTGHNDSGGSAGGAGGAMPSDSSSAARNAAAELQANANTLHAPLTAQPVQPRRDSRNKLREVKVRAKRLPSREPLPPTLDKTYLLPLGLPSLLGLNGTYYSTESTGSFPCGPYRCSYEMGPFSQSWGNLTGAWISFRVSGGLGDGQWVQTWSDSTNQTAPDCADECPFIPSYASTGQWFVDDPARPEGQSVTWVGQTSYVLPYTVGAAFTIEWGYTMSNGGLSYHPPALATPWASQQQQIWRAQLWWNP